VSAGKRFVAVLALAVAASPGLGQALGDELAEMMAAMGCEASEAELEAAFLAEGFDVEEYRAQVLALYSRSQVVPAETEGRVKLVGWGDCS
jgi:hypothetical protein